jgi:hypothetical protein
MLFFVYLCLPYLGVYAMDSVLPDLDDVGHIVDAALTNHETRHLNVEQFIF